MISSRLTNCLRCPFFFFFFVYNIVSSTKRGLGWAVGWVKKESISLIYDSTLVHDDEDMKVK